MSTTLLQCVACPVYEGEPVHFLLSKGDHCLCRRQSRAAFPSECLESVNGSQFFTLPAADLMRSALCVCVHACVCSVRTPPPRVSSKGLQIAANL